jgi:hypothetical protein
MDHLWNYNVISETVAVTRYTHLRPSRHHSIVFMSIACHLGHSVPTNKYEFISQDRSTVSPLPNIYQDSDLIASRYMVLHALGSMVLHAHNTVAAA